MKATPFPCLCVLRSADRTCVATWVERRHTCDANTEQGLLSSDFTTKVLVMQGFKLSALMKINTPSR